MAKELTTTDYEFDFESLITPMMMGMFTIVAVMFVMQDYLSKTMQAQTYVGLEYNPVLYARPQVQSLNLLADPPYTPLVSATFVNDGPDSAYISINNPDNWLELKHYPSGGESKIISALGAQRRIEEIYYKTNPGESAAIRVNGKY